MNQHGHGDLVLEREADLAMNRVSRIVDAPAAVLVWRTQPVRPGYRSPMAIPVVSKKTLSLPSACRSAVASETA